MKNKINDYYLGLDIGTDSVGYAVTNPSYDLLKFRGEPMWGTTTFEAASLAETRRMNRTARRRLDRKQQRVQLVSELFAKEICAIDPDFFIRRKESALFADDAQFGVRIFEGGITDKEYHEKYPTIHHLILELMESSEPHDVRLVYLACAWLVANRGHFLFDTTIDRVNDFTVPYKQFCEYLQQDCGCSLPWAESVPAEVIQSIMQEQVGVTRKKELFKEKVFGGKKPASKPDEAFPYRADCLVALLSGGKAAPKDLFFTDAYAEVDSISLGMDEDNFDRILSELGDDGALLRSMRAMYDCALLGITRRGFESISESKVAVYNRHAKDLEYLKAFIRKYKPKQYAVVFRKAEAGNYTAYSYNVKSCEVGANFKKAKKEAFCEFLGKIVKNIEVEDADLEAYQDMLNRIAQCTFLPKQKDSDNRVIPQQLYRAELEQILRNAQSYLPMLSECDADGFTGTQKILSVFDFRIPYYVGPLNKQSSHAWLERKPGKIYPWNFEQMVDLDESEQRFISRMTNTCTYLPGEGVLPYCSLLYSKFMVLNEINNLKVNGIGIPVSVKQAVYTDLFEKSQKKVTAKSIAAYLRSRGIITQNDEVTGVDDTVKSGLKSYHSFHSLLERGVLNQEQVEDIINHAAFSEDKRRMSLWLKKQYPALPDSDVKYILRLNLKEFGRLSRRFLTEIPGCIAAGTGEALSIIEALWQTNDNLMQLLSERYTFRDQVKAFAEEYYSDPQNKKTLSDRLSDMYISNAVKRPIIRALDVTSDVVKATGSAPKRIFIEMARGGSPDQKGKRTLSRRQQLLDLYKIVKNEDTPRLLRELEDMGELADNRLQSDRLFLYYLQLGKCMYSGQPIELGRLASDTYDIDHIYPQSKIQDDSVLNNKVLVLSGENGLKGNRYPVDAAIREKMTPFWMMLREYGLITQEKYTRLTRAAGFTDDELRAFINRQLVETRQSTKAVAQLLQEKYPETEIVYVKAGMVSEFRQEFNMLKCRSVNDLHHAKDAYLNIVVGNVYHEKFTRRWFDVHSEYTLNTYPLFSNAVNSGNTLVWQGGEDLAKVRKTMSKNAVHMTQYPLCRHSGQNGGFFDQNPKRPPVGRIPLKAGLTTERYGGYHASTCSFFSLVRFRMGKKKEMMFFPVDLLYSRQFLADPEFAAGYVQKVLAENGKNVSDVEFPMGKRILKINTLLSLDGYLCCLTSGSVIDKRVSFLPMMQFVCEYDMERYLKKLERIGDKKSTNSKYIIVPEFDGVSKEANIKLFDLYLDKLQNSPFGKRPGPSFDELLQSRDIFSSLPLETQCSALLKMHMIFTRQPNPVDLADLGMSKTAFKARKSMYLSGWKKDYRDVRIIDVSASGLFAAQSENLLELL